MPLSPSNTSQASFPYLRFIKVSQNIQRSRGINTPLGFETIHGFTTASETAYYSHDNIFKNYFKKINAEILFLAK